MEEKKKEPKLLEEEIACVDCGGQVKTIILPIVWGIRGIMGICMKCKRLYSGDGEPDFEAGTKIPAYYKRGCRFTLEGIDFVDT